MLRSPLNIDEILNISFHTRELIVKALNKFECKKHAAKALGISEKTLNMRMREFSITREGKFYGYRSKLLFKCSMEM